ncbi:UDP-N-acetylglucosamine 2-epimerase (non-hydrolyzing) [Rhodovastum atsumiense]|uniref:UDP-N-acetylglucosamine 2-epimerase (non-hydrolyzing) n=1 Tax=Rhodovastum atsumiense TaxID=504468 RepID=A0A5M6IX90_9PROT|nr:UDP-N-acetylglucosamine 2-epimerase (non-hydrolyzing) [Rhodovastum atsumiense]
MHPGLRVVLVVGTRPEANKLAPVALALRAQPGTEAMIWCTGQHARWAPDMLGHFGLAPDLDIATPAGNGELGLLAAALMTRLWAALAASRPHVVVVQGDTASAFAAALAAFYARIPVVHVEAGLRSGDCRSPFPEEAHRRAIAGFATLHCAPTPAARDALLAEAIPARDILLSGNTVIDALRLIRRIAPAGGSLPLAAGRTRPLILVTCHRRENWGAPFLSVCHAARRLAGRGDCDVVFVLHPNPALAEAARAILAGGPRLHLVPPQDYPGFVALLARAALVLTDSGGVQEEAAALGVPLLVLREATERQEGLRSGVARLVGTQEAAILAAAASLLDDPAARAAMAVPSTVYGDGHAGKRIAAAIRARWQPTPAVPDLGQMIPSASLEAGIPA